MLIAGLVVHWNKHQRPYGDACQPVRGFMEYGLCHVRRLTRGRCGLQRMTAPDSIVIRMTGLTHRWIAVTVVFVR